MKRQSEHLRLYAGSQGLDGLMDRKRGGWRRALLVLKAPAGGSGDDGGGSGRVQTLAVCVWVQRRVSGLRLVLPHHKPGQRQVFDCGDRMTGLEEGFGSAEVWGGVMVALRCRLDVYETVRLNQIIIK